MSNVFEKSGAAVHLVPDPALSLHFERLYDKQGMAVEPSSAITTAFVKAQASKLEEPICVILTGQNVTPEDHAPPAIMEESMLRRSSILLCSRIVAHLRRPRRSHPNKLLVASTFHMP